MDAGIGLLNNSENFSRPIHDDQFDRTLIAGTGLGSSRLADFQRT